MVEDEGRIVAEGYDRAADRYADLEDPAHPWPRMRWLELFLDRLPGRGRVLDLGCGAGVPVAQELARDHDVVGVDISPEQILRARLNVPDGDFRVGDGRTVELPSGHFDGVVSLYALSHVPRDQHAELLARVRAWLRPRGWLLLTADTADHPGAVDEWLGVEMFFSSFSADTTRQLVREAGFEIVETAIEPQFEEGREVEFVWILARAHDEDQRATTSSTA